MNSGYGLKVRTEIGAFEVSIVTIILNGEILNTIHTCLVPPLLLHNVLEILLRKNIMGKKEINLSLCRT